MVSNLKLADSAGASQASCAAHPSLHLLLPSVNDKTSNVQGQNQIPNGFRLYSVVQSVSLEPLHRSTSCSGIPSSNGQVVLRAVPNQHLFGQTPHNGLVGIAFTTIGRSLELFWISGFLRTQGLQFQIARNTQPAIQ